jgi:hypothetical protein
MTTQINANGTVKHQLGNGDKKVFAVQYQPAGGGPKVKREYTGVFVNFPVTPEALDAAFEKYTFTVGGVQLKGTQAAAAAKWLHAIESVRGDVRKALEAGLVEVTSEDSVRRMFLEYTGPSGERRGFTPTVVSKDTVAAFIAAGDTEGLMAYLAKQGAKVNATVEDTQDDDEQV